VEVGMVAVASPPVACGAADAMTSPCPAAKACVVDSPKIMPRNVKKSTEGDGVAATGDAPTRKCHCVRPGRKLVDPVRPCVCEAVGRAT
jgi:hypothetical protein